MNKKRCLVLIYIVFLALSLWAQDSQFIPQNWKNILEAALASGNSKALESLPKFVANETTRADAMQLLKAYTFLSAEEEARIFQPEAKMSVHFSPVLRAFFVTPIEDWAEEASYVSIQNNNNFSKKDESRLRNGLLDKKEKIAQRGQMALELATSFPTEKNFQFLMNLYSKKTISTEMLRQSLRQITNLEADKNSNIINFYKTKIDSLKTLAALREYGFNILNNNRLYFYDQSVDYYGLLLNSPDMPLWAKQNALAEMLETRHPRALFYLACQIYSQKNASEIFINTVIKQVEQLTAIKVETSENPSKSRLARQHYLVYWSIHYNNFIWNEATQQFQHKEVVSNLEQSYDKYFKDLSDVDDEKALTAYSNLLQAPPDLLAKWLAQRQATIRQTNQRLPTFKYPYAENLAVLVQYCQRNAIAWQPTPLQKKWLEQFSQNMAHSQRLALEDSLSQHLTLQEITALEMGALVFYRNSNVAFSISRIVDLVYTKYWKTLVNDKKELELYVKKINIFSKIDVLGSCAHYQRKLNVNEKNTRTLLHSLQKTTNDKDVLEALKTLVDKKNSENNVTFSEFLKNPQGFDTREIATIQKPRPADVVAIFASIDTTGSPKALRSLYALLSAHPSEAMVPHIFALKNSVIIHKFNTNLLTTIYEHRKESYEEWVAHWEKNHRTFEEWGYIFIDERLQNLAKQTTDLVSLDELNSLAESRFFNPQRHKHQLLSILQQKLKPEDAARLSELSLAQKLSSNSDIHYFKYIKIHYKNIDDFLKLFDTESPDNLVAFAFKQLENYTSYQQGFAFSRLLRHLWFQKYVFGLKHNNMIINNIRVSLHDFLIQSDLLGEFEENQLHAYLALLKVAGLPLQQKLEQISKEQQHLKGSALKSVYENIFASVTYEELPVVIQFLLENGASPETFEFINNDFGIPFFEWSDAKKVSDFVNLLTQLPPKQLHEQLLQGQLKTPLRNKNGHLNFQMIYNILKYDLTLPYYEARGEWRDGHVFATIKILEQHFKTRLGFHEKLNENQSFYIHNALARATAWRNFLIQKKQAKDDGILSFQLYNN